MRVLCLELQSWHTRLYQWICRNIWRILISHVKQTIKQIKRHCEINIYSKRVIINWGKKKVLYHETSAIAIINSEAILKFQGVIVKAR